MTSAWSDHDGPRGTEYDARWDRLAASGASIHGEADLVASMAPATVLDAGCGTGRVAIELAARGLSVAGADLDPAMLASARAKAPDLDWFETDLAALDLRDPDGDRRRFDVVVAAGNVMIFVAPGTEATVVAHLADHVADDGSLVAGFQLGPGRLTLDDYDRCAAAAGLHLIDRWATWTRDPFVEGGDYAVSVHGR